MLLPLSLLPSPLLFRIFFNTTGVLLHIKKWKETYPMFLQASLSTTITTTKILELIATNTMISVSQETKSTYSTRLIKKLDVVQLTVSQILIAVITQLYQTKIQALAVL